MAIIDINIMKIVLLDKNNRCTNKNIEFKNRRGENKK